MIKEVTFYKTADGKTFPTEQQAERHANDILCQKVEAFLDGYFSTGHIPSTLKAVTALTEDRALAIAQLKELLFILNYDNNE